MSHLPLPAFFTGAITLEYGHLSLNAAEEEPNPNDTCGSDCSDGDCGKETCAAQEKETSYRAKAFQPVIAGWNEPPAAQF